MGSTTFETERLSLRPFSPADGEAFHRVWGDPEVIWWGALSDRADSDAALAELIEKCRALLPGLGWWWLVERSTGDRVGDLVLVPAPDPPGGIEIGWHLARARWGEGFATEGARRLLDHAWDLGLDEVIATIVPMNAASVGVAERLGMARRGALFVRGGLWHDVWAIGNPASSPMPV